MMALVQIIFAIPVSLAVEKYGASKVIMVASILNTLGLTIKCLINEGFWFCILGQFFASITAQVVIGASTKLAATWFPPRERITAISLYVVG